MFVQRPVYDINGEWKTYGRRGNLNPVGSNGERERIRNQRHPVAYPMYLTAVG